MGKFLKKISLFILCLLTPILLFSQIERTMVVMEVGTGTWCTYCPGAAMGADDLLENGKFVAVIENHNGDPFANVYSNSRNSYYGITGYPTAIFDGVSAVVGGSHSSSMYASYLPKYNARIAVPANVKLEWTISNTGLDYTAIITATKVGTITATNLKLHLFITVSNVQYNWQGQTHLEHINVKMVPDQNGTAFNFNSGDVQTFTLNWTMDPTWDINDVEFITFVQDATSTKEIFNGVKRGGVDLTLEFTADSTYTLKNMPVIFTNSTYGGYIGVPETYEWIFEGGTPSTSIDKNPVVTYSQIGKYDVTLIVNRGGQIDTITKNDYIEVDVGVNNSGVINPKVHISPNPNNGKFKIVTDGTYELIITNMIGIQSYRTTVNSSVLLNLNLKSGIYFVILQNENGKIVRKITVN